MADLIEMPRWFLALALIAAGAVGGGACAAIDCLIRGRQQ
jgi:ABC-type uncharacterized transport system permease subunit